MALIHTPTAFPMRNPPCLHTAEEIAQWKAKIANLEQREQNENNVNTKNDLNQRIIESTKTLNLLLAQQGTFLFPDLSRRLCVSFLSWSRSMKGRPSCVLFEIVLLFTFLLLPFYFLPFPLRYFTSPSHLHVGCHSKLLSVPADKAGRSWVDSFSWLLHVILFAFLAHAGAT